MSSVPHATPSTLPEIRAGGKGGAGDEPLRWDMLVSRLLHPIQLSMIEALLWVGLPIAPSDLAHMYDGEYTDSHAAYHVRVLVKHGIIELADVEPVRGVTRHLYVLSPDLQWR